MPKPEAAAFAAVFALDGLAPERAAMFEDDPRNLAVPHGLGMRTVLVGPAAAHPHVHHQTEDLGGLPRASPDQPGVERIEIDVLVAGGGVAGLTAAAAFAAAGFRVALRRSGAAGHLGRGGGLGPAEHGLPAAGGDAPASGPGSGSGWRRRRRRSG